MHIDTSELENGAVIAGDVCIVGAGAAGISMALDWIGSRHQVVLLEAGGFSYEAASQEQYRGEIIGEPYFPLHAARLRYFGGTTGHWAGYCAPFDEIDFADRDWVPDSSWPIRLDDLHPYYARANQVLELGPYDYSADYWEARDPQVRRLHLGDAFWTKMWQFSPPTRFGIVYRDRIVNARNLHLYTHAAVCELLANDDVSAIEGLRVRTLAGAEHQVTARHYVLACGAIQNARLLLASNARAAAGIGNDHDLVGRYFMEHIEIPGAGVLFEKRQSLKMYVAQPRNSGANTPARGELALVPEIQRENRILNGTASIVPGWWDGRVTSTFQENPPEELESWRAGEERGNRSDEPPPPLPEPQRAYRLFTRQEQAPNPDSRIMLGAGLDALGMPRVRLDWRLTGLDKRSIRRFYQLLGRALGRTGLGRLQLADWLIDVNDDTGWPEFLSGGWHHMGTARMHEDPRHGVVDANCKVHGIGNLHVAGSATFTTAGAPNPTLTLVALSLRLSDRIKGLMR